MIRYSIICLSFFLISCSGPDATEIEKTAEIEKTEAKTDLKAQPIRVKEATELTDKNGLIGIFHVPEMLSFTILDSADMGTVSKKISKNFRLLVEDIQHAGAEINGSGGVIYYTNDPNNFKFECILPIKDMPKNKPKHSQVVVLEEDKMIIFNYYGVYQKLYTAYDEIRKYEEANHLEQSGPMREFYLSDPVVEKDSTKWLTRIMVPVK